MTPAGKSLKCNPVHSPTREHTPTHLHAFPTDKKLWGQNVLAHPDRDTTTFHQRWHSALLFSDRMSQIAEPSHVQLCLCNPNTGRNAKSSHPAVVSHPGYCAVVRYGVVKGPLEE